VILCPINIWAKIVERISSYSSCTDIDRILQELGNICHLISGHTEEEPKEYKANLAMLTGFEREGVLARCYEAYHAYQAYQACKEMEKLQEQQEARSQRMVELAKEKKRREEK
jgi:hypothetical protein